MSSTVVESVDSIEAPAADVADASSLRVEARGLSRALAAFVGRVDAAAVSGSLGGGDAAAVASLLAGVERLASAGKTVAAGRVAATGQSLLQREVVRCRASHLWSHRQVD